MSAWAQDGSKRQALAAILAQKGAQKSVRARQFREIGVLDRWKQTLEDRNEQNNEKTLIPMSLRAIGGTKNFDLRQNGLKRD